MARGKGPDAVRYKWSRQPNGKYTIYDVPIMAGLPGGVRPSLPDGIGPDQMQARVESAIEDAREGSFFSRGFADHHEKGTKKSQRGLCYLDNFYYIEDPRELKQRKINLKKNSAPVLFSDLVEIPEAAFGDFMDGKYGYRSPEVYGGGEAGETFGLAFLETRPPHWELPVLLLEADESATPPEAVARFAARQEAEQFAPDPAVPTEDYDGPMDYDRCHEMLAECRALLHRVEHSLMEMAPERAEDNMAKDEPAKDRPIEPATSGAHFDAEAFASRMGEAIKDGISKAMEPFEKKFEAFERASAKDAVMKRAKEAGITGEKQLSYLEGVLVKNGPEAAEDAIEMFSAMLPEQKADGDADGDAGVEDKKDFVRKAEFDLDEDAIKKARAEFGKKADREAYDKALQDWKDSASQENKEDAEKFMALHPEPAVFASHVANLVKAEREANSL